jgi:tRNA pseudouridine38-40 synthase
MKIALGIEYCGTHFFGWQRQKKMRTVQQVIEEALSMVADQPVKTTCAGRTDTGVHALQQVIHIDTHAKRKFHSWVLGCNVNLPEDVSVLWAKQMDDDFDARFSATTRKYQYVILNRMSRPGVQTGKVTWIYESLNVEKMQEAANYLIGEHDFTSYRALACQATSPVRTVKQINLSRNNELIVMTIEANAFLHHMVRNIVGVLLTIGYGKEKPSWAKYVLDACDRTVGGVTAPPQGLYLVSVEYPERYDIPKPVPLYYF